MRIYEKGTIKVVWLDKDPERIYSKMFDTVEEATIFMSTKKESIVFRLVTQKNMEEFEWEILPHGQYSLYKKAITLYQKHKEKILPLLSKFL